ncbi:MAG: LmbE family protein [Opitutaceae bacterium]|nr:LmbE family protein [Opitutaceae bacterium]
MHDRTGGSADPLRENRDGCGTAPRNVRPWAQRTALVVVLGLVTWRAVAGESPAGIAIQQDLRSFGTYATVLHVAAHPDDENRGLLAYLSRIRGYRTGYLSVTRGDGGQNEIGPEFGEKLGLARTQELLAGRAIDGVRQFFTRALDFGYAKSITEALSVWDRQQVLGDVVRVIRTFRPDVIITRFSPQAQAGNHGHHNASALLALEAFKISGDSQAFPEQIAQGLTPWQPTRILQNGGGGFSISAGGTDPVTRDSVQTIAAQTSAQHKTQFGPGGGGRGGRGGASGDERTETFSLLAGAPAKADIMDGLDLTWARMPGGAELGRLAAAALASFKPGDPAASVPSLLALRAQLAKLPADFVVDDKRQQLDRILQACLGITVETTAPSAEVVPGEKLTLAASVVVHSKFPVRWTSTHVSYPGGGLSVDGFESSRTSTELVLDLPANVPVSHPYWLREEATAGMFRVADPKLIGQPENPPPFMVDCTFDVGDQKLVVSSEPLAPTKPGKPGRRLVVISPISLRFSSGVALFTPGERKKIEVEVTAARAGERGSLRLEAPAGWTVSPSSQPFQLGKNGEQTRLAFAVTAPEKSAAGTVLAVAEVGGVKFSHQRTEIRYDHIPLQILQAPARLKVAAFDYATRGKNVGYLPGAGDDTVEALEQLGYTVTMLTGPGLTAEKLRGLDAVVIGVRAFNERADLAANFPGLLAYVEAGGTVIAQYNRPNGLKAQQLGPYALSIAESARSAPKWRVTEENAPVLFLAPDHAALTRPNRLGPADFVGWVQERGAYFPNSWDEKHYTPVLAMNDTDERPLTSSLLVAKHGKGYYVYTGLAFFRQLPAGVPGGYRLFANLLALGRE